MEISHKNNDIVLKYMSGAFKDTALEFYGLNIPKIKSVVPTELPVLEVSEDMMDFVFELEDESYLHLEFQTTAKQDNLERFMLYDARLYRKDKRRIHTAVVYSGNIERAENWLDIGSIDYRVKNIYMRDYDGDSIYLELSEKIDRGDKLLRLDIMNLVFLPLMRTTESREEMAVHAVQLADRILDREMKNFCTGAIIGISFKFIDKDWVNKLKEALRMNWFVEEIKKDGKIEEKIEVAKKLIKKGTDIDTIAEITELPKEEIEKLKHVS